MQVDSQIYQLHTLIFKTQATAWAAHATIIGLVGAQFKACDVQPGGKRHSTVLGEPPPSGTWRYQFVTFDPLSHQQMSQIHLATNADEALWNQPSHQTRLLAR